MTTDPGPEIREHARPVSLLRETLTKLFRSGEFELGAFMTNYHNLLKDRSTASDRDRTDIDQQLIAIREFRDRLKSDASEPARGLVLRIEASADLFLVPLDTIATDHAE